jgi:putative PIN family toxin of toxin-antitoxin system
MQRIVLDTDVIVASLRSPEGASAALLRLLDEGRGTLLISVALALEYDAVCRRPEHLAASGLNNAQIEIFLNGLVNLAEPVKSYFRWRPLLSDAGDEMVLDVAVNGQADWLVTFNRKHFGKTPAAFGIELLLPREALLRMRK